MLSLVQIVLTAAHLMAVSIAAVGPLVCLWLEWREHRRGDAVAGDAGRRLAALTLKMFCWGMVLGVAALGLLWLRDSRNYLQALSLIPRGRLWFGLAELAFYAVCMAAYVRWWAEMPRWAHRGLAVLAATNVLYHFPPLFSSVAVISTRDHLLMIGRPLERLELLALFVDGETLSRVAHLLLAGCVMTGVALMRLAARGDADHGDTQGPARWGGRLALAAALLQFPGGVWVLLNLPAGRREQLLLADPWATGFFALAIVVMLVLLHHLAAVALGDTAGAVSSRCLVLTGLLFLLMVAAGHRTRTVQSGMAPNVPASTASKRNGDTRDALSSQSGL